MSNMTEILRKLNRKANIVVAVTLLSFVLVFLVIWFITGSIELGIVASVVGAGVYVIGDQYI